MSQNTPIEGLSLHDELKKTYNFISSYNTWRQSGNLENSEDSILRLLPFYPNGDSIRKCKILDVEIGDGNNIHEFYIENTQETTRNHSRDIVMVHGYGAALGLFIRNFEGLSNVPGLKLHSIDMLGYGLSSRPKFPKTGIWSLFFGNKNITKEDVYAAENFFIDSIESWRIKREVEKFVLVGHSLGGYLSCCYALKYPERVEKLILISPVGVERSIYDLTKKHTRNHDHAGKLGPDIGQELKTNHSNNTTDRSTSSSFHVPDETGFVERVPNLPRIFKIMWDYNISPFKILRNIGPWGPLLCSYWSFNRFSHCKTREEIMKFHEYTYNIFNAKGSGEYALTKILAPGVLARIPLLSRVPGKLQCDSIWMYGSNDWMSKEAGSVIVNELKKMNTSAEYKVINDAGHHVYLDNPIDFNYELMKFLKL